jgi:DNA repair protein SbcC/Rad50
MHISQVDLTNFMRYDQASITLAPGFNAFVGQTDSGKSTILRAIVWVMYNRPTGMEMCREGTDETSVTLTIQSETTHTVTRYRSKKRNAYCLDGQWFDTVKTDVPDEIKTAMGVQLAELGPKVLEMLNVSRQMDGPFMLTGSGGDAAKILGNLSGITVIDQGLSSLKPDLTKASSDISSTERLERTYTAAMHEFSDLEEEGLLLKSTSEKIRLAQELDQRHERLTALVEKMVSFNATIATLDDQILEQEEVLGINSNVEASIVQQNQLADLDALLQKMEEYNTQFHELTGQIAQAESRLIELQHGHQHALEEAGACPLCGQHVAVA